MPMLGGWVGGPDDRFGPLKDLAYCDLCRPSDFVLTHYQLFAEARSRPRIKPTQSLNLSSHTWHTATSAARPDFVLTHYQLNALLLHAGGHRACERLAECAGGVAVRAC